MTATDVPSRMLSAAEGISLAIAARPMAENVRHRVVPAGRTLGQLIEAEGLGGTGWDVRVGGVSVPVGQWGRVRVRPGNLVEIRAKPGKSVVAVAAMIALTVYAPQLAALTGATGIGASAVSGAIVFGGSLVVNKLLAPKAQAAPAAASNASETTFALSAGSNNPRLYAPLSLQLGECKVVPDLAAQQYTWFEGEDQYLSCLLHAGINCGSVDQIRVGDTLLSDYQGVQVSRGYFPSGNDGAMPSASVDSIQGALLDNPNAAGTFGAWTTRTTSVNTTRIAVDIEANLTATVDTGAYQRHYADVEYQYAPVGTGAWQPLLGGSGVINLTNLGGKPLRATYTADVEPDQYDVRGRKRSANDTITTQQNVITWTQLKSYQADTADYSGQPRVRIEVKASGQLSGSLNSVNWIGRADGLPLWDGQQWVTVNEPGSSGTSNPGAQILQLLRGIRRPSDGRLMAGLGLPDSKIDLDSLKAFMRRCAAKDFRFDAFIQEQMSITDLIDAIADVGFGRLSRASGKFGVIWLAEDQPIQGVLNMARMKAKSFSVDYDMSPSADELEYQFYDAENGWVQSPVRVVDPTLVGTPQRTASLPVRGTTRGAQAARRARFTLGQGLYAKKSISFELDLEHLVYPRGAVVAVSHDLTQWGYSGRLAGFSKTAGTFTLQLDEPLPNLASAVRTMGLQLSGEANMRVYQVGSVASDGRTVLINAAWPADVPVPGAQRPVHDTVWLFDVKATPGLRARVVSVVPNSNMTGAKVTVVPESMQFWDYVWGGAWTQPGKDSLLPVTPPVAGNAAISAERVRVGEAWRTQLTVVFDAAGNYDHAQVWGSADGAPMVRLGETGGTRLSWYADAGRQWSVEVRPFDGLGRLGGIATALYNVASNLPANVLGLALDMTAAGVVASWKAPAGIGAVDWSLTEVRRGAAFDTAPVIYSGRGTTVALGWLLAGTTTIWARQKSTAGEWSDPVSTALVVQTPAQPNVVAGRDLSLVSFRWNDCTTSQPIKAYQVRDGATFDGAISLGQVTATSYTRNEAAAGVHKYWVQAVDAAGNVGAPGSQTIETLPGFEQAKAELTAGLAGVTQQILDPVKGLDALKDHIDTSVGELDQLLTGGVEVVRPQRPVIQALADQQATNASLLSSLGMTAEGLLANVVGYGELRQGLRKAGIDVDDKAGTVRIYALAALGESVNQQQVVLDAVKGALSLRATTAEMDQKIAAAIADATLNPADLALFEGMSARVTMVEATLNSVTGQLLLKASTASVESLKGQITDAVARLDSAEAAIELRVTRAEFDASTGNITGRLSNAETTLSALDVAAITNSVSQSRGNVGDIQAGAVAGLAALIAQWEGKQQGDLQYARGREELAAKINADVSAEAQKRTSLEAVVSSNKALAAAQVEQSSAVAATATSALATRVDGLASTVSTDTAALASQIGQTASTAANATSALANRVDTLTSTVTGNAGTAAANLSNAVNTLANADSALGGRVDALSVTVSGNASTAASNLSSAVNTLATADSALGGRVDALSATVTGNAATTAANLSSAVNVLVGADNALSGRVDTLLATVSSNASTSSTGIANEASARAAADAAEVIARALLSSKVLGVVDPTGVSLPSLSSGILYEERQSRAAADAAQVSTTSSLQASVDANFAGVTSTLQALTNTQGSQAGSISALSASVAGNTATIGVQQAVLASVTGQLSATWALTVKAGSYVAGMSANNDGSTSALVFLFDKIAFAQNVGGTPHYLLTAGTVAGVSTVGVDGNLIVDGSVKVRSIYAENLAAIVAKLGMVTAGRLDMIDDGSGGWGYVRSYPKWIADGQTGWVFARHADGSVLAEIKAGPSRLAMNSADNSFYLEGPGFTLSNAGLFIGAIGVIDTLQLAGQAVTVPASIEGATNDLNFYYLIPGAGEFDVVIIAAMAISVASNFVLEVDGDQKFSELPGSGSLACRFKKVRLSAGTPHLIRVFSPHPANTNSAGLYVLATKR